MQPIGRWFSQSISLSFLCVVQYEDVFNLSAGSVYLFLLLQFRARARFTVASIFFFGQALEFLNDLKFRICVSIDSAQTENK